jgi:hypothetical protein
MRLRVILAAIAAVLLAVVSFGLSSGTAHAGTFSSSAPGPPVGWNTVQYSHDFTTQGNGDWTVQPGAGATVSNSTRFGLGITLNSTSEWAEVIQGNGNNFFLGPNEFIEALVYIPSGSGSNGAGTNYPAGSTANWPAFWTSGPDSTWPTSGEIDALEGQNGRSCEQTHYGPSRSDVMNSASNCAPLGADSTGWLTLSILRENQHVYEWYTNGSTVIPVGTVELPTNANEELKFQDQSQNGSNNFFGPTLLGSASTAWLSKVEVWTN